MSITLNEFTALKPGDKVRIIKIDGGRPEHWNSLGLMDKYAGQVVTIDCTYDYRFKIKEDNKCWGWIYTDIDSIVVKDWPDYCDSDVLMAKHISYQSALDERRGILNKIYGSGAFRKEPLIQIDKVIFNDPATIVFWKDGTKTVVKAGNDEYFDKEKGLAMAISKKVLGNKGNYYNAFKKHGAIDTDKEIYIPLSLLKECTTLKKMKELIKYMEGKL